ncbi:hypothetical protein [Aeromicrobium sp.]|uniref:hypothetical protein n=1 Tax=Aeromicrobium sp. TaxID=1871063 RepID=UPI0030C11FBC
MLHLRITSPTDLTDDVLAVLSDEVAVSSLAVFRGAAVRPSGDVVLADIAREAANGLIDQLQGLGLARSGSIHVQPV